MKTPTTFKEALLSLIGIRKFIAVAITIMFVVLVSFQFFYMMKPETTITKDDLMFHPELIKTVVVTVIAYYFAKSTALDSPEESTKKKACGKPTCSHESSVEALYCEKCGHHFT